MRIMVPIFLSLAAKETLTSLVDEDVCMVVPSL
jgi:hypothetical protein